MASHQDFVDYVAEQLREAGAIRSRKMFGEYGLYCDGVFFAVICDDQFFVKVTPAGEAAFPHLPKARPMRGPGLHLGGGCGRPGHHDRPHPPHLSGPSGTAAEKTEEMTMAFDYKKEYKEFYLPPRTPGIVTVPAMNFLAVRGQGDPNEEGGAYKQALELLYAVAYTIKMSKMGKHKLEGYFDYVVPPWRACGGRRASTGWTIPAKADFRWISLIRLPEFVTKEVFDWAIREATEKKQQDFSPVEFFPWEEGLCVQCMHIGPYDDEPATVAAMEEYARAQGYEADFRQGRFHHEIYLSDVRRCKPEKAENRHPAAHQTGRVRKEMNTIIRKIRPEE